MGAKRSCSHVTLGRPKMDICLTKVGKFLFPAITRACFTLFGLCSGRAKYILQCSDVRTLKLPNCTTIYRVACMCIYIIKILSSNCWGSWACQDSCYTSLVSCIPYQALLHPSIKNNSGIKICRVHLLESTWPPSLCRPTGNPSGLSSAQVSASKAPKGSPGMQAWHKKWDGGVFRRDTGLLLFKYITKHQHPNLLLEYYISTCSSKMWEFKRW